MKNYPKNKITIFLVLYLIIQTSCKNNDREYVKIIGSKTLSKSIYKKNSNIENGKYLYDNKGNLTTDILILEDSDTVFRYEMTVRNSSKQIVYFCEYKNGLILKEFDFFIFKGTSIENGSFLYRNYCFYCHIYNKSSIGQSKRKMSKLSKENIISGYLYSKEHDSIPQLTKIQLLALVKYIRT